MHEVSLEIEPPSAILMDGVMGQVIFEKKTEARLSPGGLRKKLTLYLAFDALKGGRVNPDQMILVSEGAWKMGDSQMFLELWGELPCIELLKEVVAPSANEGSAGHSQGFGGFRGAL